MKCIHDNTHINNLMTNYKTSTCVPTNTRDKSTRNNILSTPWSFHCDLRFQSYFALLPHSNHCSDSNDKHFLAFLPTHAYPHVFPPKCSLVYMVVDLMNRVLHILCLASFYCCIEF